jgi:hypothetical protein
MPPDLVRGISAAAAAAGGVDNGSRTMADVGRSGRKRRRRRRRRKRRWGDSTTPLRRRQSIRGSIVGRGGDAPIGRQGGSARWRRRRSGWSDVFGEQAKIAIPDRRHRRKVWVIWAAPSSILRLDRLTDLMGQWAQWHGGLDGHARLDRLNRRAQLDGLDSTGSTRWARLDLMGSTGALDSTGRSACRIATLARSSLGARSLPNNLSSPTPRRWRPPRIAAAPPSRDGA